MSSTKWFLAIALLGLQLTHPVYAAIYKCKAANEEVTYSSRKCANNAEFFTPKLDYRPSQTKQPEQVQVKPSVDIYITSWCPYCKKAMAYLSSKDIPFNAYDIEQDSQAKAKKLSLDPSYTGVPLTVINGKLLKGFSKSRFEQALAPKK